MCHVVVDIRVDSRNIVFTGLSEVPPNIKICLFMFFFACVCWFVFELNIIPLLLPATIIG